MVDVEESPLRAFEQNVLPLPHGFVEQHNRVDHKRLQPVARRAIGSMNFLEGERFRAKSLEDFVVLPDFVAQDLLKARRVDQVDHARTSPRRFIAVGRADAAFGRPDPVFAFQNLPLRVQLPMIRKHQVRRFADEQVAFALHA